MATTTFSGPIKAGTISNTTGTTLGDNVKNVGQVVMTQSSEDKHRKTGKVMYLLAWVSGLLLLTLWFEGKLEKQWNPDQQIVQDARGEQLVLERNRFGHYVTDGRINLTFRTVLPA